MKVVWILCVLILLLVELSSAQYPLSSIDPYGRVERDSRMSQDLDDEDEEVDDEENEDEDEDEQDDDIYPPDFSKLFPNPDSRPVGPEGGNQKQQPSQYSGNHPTDPQQGRPVHGPASLRGPAALRGPSQAQHGQRQGGIGSGGPPPSYRRGPPPSSHGPPRGPPPQYRDDLNEVDEEETLPEGRQLMSYGPRRVVSYPNRRIAVQPQQRPLVSYPMYQNRVTYPRYPIYNYNQRPGVRMSYSPRYTPMPIRRYRSEEVGPVVIPRSGGARIYNPWSVSPLRADSYNPRFIVNPTEMLSRRRFRYHPSQVMPSQRIPVYSGAWGNPRNSYVHSQTGAHYGSPYWASTRY